MRFLKDTYYRLADATVALRQDVAHLHQQQQEIHRQLIQTLSHKDGFDPSAYSNLRNQYHQIRAEIQYRLPSTQARIDEVAQQHRQALTLIPLERGNLLLDKRDPFPPLDKPIQVHGVCMSLETRLKQLDLSEAYHQSQLRPENRRSLANNTAEAPHPHDYQKIHNLEKTPVPEIRHPEHKLEFNSDSFRQAVRQLRSATNELASLLTREAAHEM